MRAAQIIVDIVNSGGFIVAEKGEIVARKVPSHLIPHIRQNKSALLALLSPQPFTPLPSERCPDAYAMAERRAIQAESMDDITAPAPMQPAPSMAPQRVTCSQCCRFQPGPQPLSVGRCLATVDGQPPAGNRGDYRAAFPLAARSCTEFSGVQS